MGRAAAWDLARQPATEVVRLVDRDHQALTAARREIEALLEAGVGKGSTRANIETEVFDLERDTGLENLLGWATVTVSSADYRFNEAITRAAIEAHTHLCDMGGNIFVVEKQLALSDRAEAAGVTIVPDCGLAPGMACLLAARLVDELEDVTKVRLRVGGLPAHPRPPLNYKLVFSVRGLTNEYLEPAEVLRDGHCKRLPSLTEVEELEFPPPFGKLEAFHTSGGASTLTRTLRHRVRDLDYKTIRYPGHCAVFRGMQSLGMLDEEPVDGVVPREFTERMLERALTDDDTDVVLVRVSAEGTRDGHRVRLVNEVIDRHDVQTGHSAMARCTAYPTAAIAYMIAAGAIEKRGVLPGESCVPLDTFVSAVEARGIDVKERFEQL